MVQINAKSFKQNVLFDSFKCFYEQELNQQNFYKIKLVIFQ